MAGARLEVEMKAKAPPEEDQHSDRKPRCAEPVSGPAIRNNQPSIRSNSTFVDMGAMTSPGALLSSICCASPRICRYGWTGRPAWILRCQKHGISRTTESSAIRLEAEKHGVLLFIGTRRGENIDMTTDYRIERDTMGEVRVAGGALCTVRKPSVRWTIFPISGLRFPRSFIYPPALGLIKAAAAKVNGEAAVEASRQSGDGGRPRFLNSCWTSSRPAAAPRLI